MFHFQAPGPGHRGYLPIHRFHQTDLIPFIPQTPWKTRPHRKGTICLSPRTRLHFRRSFLAKAVMGGARTPRTRGADSWKTLNHPETTFFFYFWKIWRENYVGTHWPTFQSNCYTSIDRATMVWKRLQTRIPGPGPILHLFYKICGFSTTSSSIYTKYQNTKPEGPAC